MDEGGERVVRQLPGAVAQHSLERRVRLDDLARKVDPRDADRRPIEDGSESGGDRHRADRPCGPDHRGEPGDRKSTRLYSSHDQISYAVFFFEKKKTKRR